MEKLLHYTWKHRLFPLTPLRTTSDEALEVIDPGLYNRNAGPDFFNAKIKIGKTVWIGNIELHLKSSDWYLHMHHTDPHYNNVILHVVEKVDQEVKTLNGRLLPQVELPISPTVKTNYKQLLRIDTYPPCYKIIPQIQPLLIHNWLSSLTIKRLERKTKHVLELVKKNKGDWKKAYFITLARNFGFGINGDVFEEWAQNIPLLAVGKHRDNLFQIEAFFMGQAGLLATKLPSIIKERIYKEDYYMALSREYHFLAHKFSLKPIDGTKWRFLRLRPQNFPYIRLSQLALLYYRNKADFSKIIEINNLDLLIKCLSTQVTLYWRNHYTFKKESKESAKILQKESLYLLIINTVCPLLFAYGRYHLKEELCERAYNFLEEMRAEKNRITRSWEIAGIHVNTAADSQALIELQKQYCDSKDCLRCHFGYEFLKSTE